MHIAIRHSLVACLFLLMASATGPVRADALQDSAAPSSEPLPLAVVAGRSITAEELEGRLRRREIGRKRQAVAKALEQRVEFELLYAAAQRSGVAEDAEVIEAIRRLIVDRFLEHALLPQLEAIVITDEEVEEAYRARRSELQEPGAARGAWILIRVPKSASADKRGQMRRRADAARAEALKLGAETRSFGGVAVRYSDDQATRYRGGDIGWMVADDPSRFGPEVVSTLQALESPGAVSPVIETETGFAVVKLMERRSGRLRSLDEVRQRLVHELHLERRREVKRDLLTRLAEEIPVEIFRDRLSADAPLSARGTERPPSNPE